MAKPFSNFGMIQEAIYPLFSHSRPQKDHRPKGGNPFGKNLLNFKGKPEQSDGNPVYHLGGRGSLFLGLGIGLGTGL